MVEVVQALQTSIEIVGKLRELSSKVKEAEFKMLLADLSSELGDAKLQTANLKIEVATLREENSKLKEQLSAQRTGRPTLVGAVYQFEGDDGSFCTACFDVKSQRVRVRALTGAFTAFGEWECPSCKATYG